MAVWKFQLLPQTSDVVATGYRMDSVGQQVEDEVNDALPYRFRFHKITKIVLLLGPGDIQTAPYAELSGVAQKVVADFDLSKYSRSSDEKKRSLLRELVISQFNWLEENFDDAGFVALARAKLTWAA